MNPAALKSNIADLRPGGTLIANTDEFSRRNLAKVGYGSDPLDDGALDAFQVHRVAMSALTLGALAETGLGKKDAERSKNMFALGLRAAAARCPGVGRCIGVPWSRSPGRAGSAGSSESRRPARTSG